MNHLKNNTEQKNQTQKKATYAWFFYIKLKSMYNYRVLEVMAKYLPLEKQKRSK